MQFSGTSRAAHKMDTDWGMVIFKTGIASLVAWLMAGFIAYYFVGYEGLVTVAKPFTVTGEWAAGMYLTYPSLLNSIMYGGLSLIAIAMLAVAVKHELPRMRVERRHQGKHAARAQDIDSQVAAAAKALNETDDVTHYITSLPFSK